MVWKVLSNRSSKAPLEFGLRLSEIKVSLRDCPEPPICSREPYTRRSECRDNGKVSLTKPEQVESNRSCGPRFWEVHVPVSSSTCCGTSAQTKTSLSLLALLVRTSTPLVMMRWLKIGPGKFILNFCISILFVSQICGELIGEIQPVKMKDLRGQF